MNSAVKIKNLTHFYKNGFKKRIQALNNINLNIKKGEVVALIGPDGVGKSTLLAIISGVKKIQDGGKVFVLGGDIKKSKHRSNIAIDIAYMPQGLGSNLYSELSVYENIKFFAKLFELPRKKMEGRIELVMKQTDLYDFRNRQVKKLSGGMKQKLGLCCSLVHDPKLLILDEPTTGIDPYSRLNFWSLVWEIRNKSNNMTIIVSSAYMSEVEQFGRIVMMNNGEIIADGTPPEIKKKNRTKTLEQAYIEMLPAEERKLAVKFHAKKLDLSKQPIVIKAEKITKKFDSFVAVDHIDFEIKQGEIFGFVGPNGCGKTTTLKMITGLLPETEGKHKVFGRSIKVGDMEIRKHIGYMSQTFSLYGELTVYENLYLHTGLFNLSKCTSERRIKESIVKFKLKEYINAKSANLPLGVKQRLSLAISIIHKPEILILDEPTSGVDPITRDNFWKMILDLSRKKGITIFVTTHYLNEALRCDRVAMMNEGKLLECDTPEEIVRKKKTKNLEEAFIEYIKEFHAAETAT